MKNQIILRGRAITATPYGKTWWVPPARRLTMKYVFIDCRRHHRQIAGSILTPKAVEGYASVLDYESLFGPSTTSPREVLCL
jgi:hypothetical protein